MLWERSVAMSRAETLTMPLESMANVTSICGTPRGAGGMPTSSNLPSDLFSAAIWRSPCRTWTATLLWLSATVVKICVFLVGIVELRSISLVNRPPWVSTPSDSGVTSSSTRSLMSPRRMPPWMAAPIGHDLVGVDLAVGLLAEDPLDRLDHHAACGSGRRPAAPRRSASARRPACLQRVAGRGPRCARPGRDHLLELAAG